MRLWFAVLARKCALASSSDLSLTIASHRFPSTLHSTPYLVSFVCLSVCIPVRLRSRFACSSIYFSLSILFLHTQPLGKPSRVCCTFRKLRLCRMIRAFRAAKFPDLTHILTNCVHGIESQPLRIACQTEVIKIVENSSCNAQPLRLITRHGTDKYNTKSD